MFKRNIKTSREIGEKIKRKRRELGMTQEELAVKLGVTYQQIQRYESGANKLNVENLQVIAGVMGTPVSYFFEDRNKERHNVSEELIPFLPGEEGRLLGHFRKIRKRDYRNLVLQIARLASKDRI